MHHGTTGISTAAHFTGMNNYDAMPGESDYPTVFQGEHNGAYGDAEWHTTPHVEPPCFYLKPGMRSVAYSIFRKASRSAPTARCKAFANATLSSRPASR